MCTYTYTQSRNTTTMTTVHTQAVLAPARAEWERGGGGERAGEASEWSYPAEPQTGRTWASKLRANPAGKDGEVFNA